MYLTSTIYFILYYYSILYLFSNLCSSSVKYVADAITIPKTFYTYEGGGFSVNLGHDFIENMNTLNNLMNAEWIDSATRLVVIEMNVYFDGIDFFHLIK